MQIVLRGKKVHARAKIIIMQMLDQIQNPEHKHLGVRMKIKDVTDVTVTQVFNELLWVIKKENPAIVEQMLAEGLARPEDEPSDQEAMVEELAND